MRILLAGCLALSTGAGIALAQQTGALPSAAASKSTRDEAVADCVQLWDKGTHMSKLAWARTCRRIQTRLESLKIENLKVQGADAPAKSRTGAKGGSNSSN